MDAREQLRRYLEQRREMGETELRARPHDRRRSACAYSALPEGAGIERLDVDVRRAADPNDRRAIRRAARCGGRESSKPVDRLTNLQVRPVRPVRPVDASTANREGRRRHVVADAAGGERRAAAATDRVGGAGNLRRNTGWRTVRRSGGAARHAREARERRSRRARKCPLYATATNPVPGEGNPNADFMCVGEAPGATEDETGRPFVGAAGQLLTKILGGDRPQARRRLHLQRAQAPSAGQPQSAAGRGDGVQPVPDSSDRAHSPESDSRARHVRGADTLEHEAIDRQVARPGSPLLRRAARRHVSSRGASPESGVGSVPPGKMSSSPVEYSIAQHTRRRVIRTAIGVLRTRRTPSKRCSSAMLIDQDAVLRAVEHVDDTMFYAERHRRIFRAMVAHHRARRRRRSAHAVRRARATRRARRRRAARTTSASSSTPCRRRRTSSITRRSSARRRSCAG